MQLLVSVSRGSEVAAAIDGGADIIDAKDPARGSLGAVELDVLDGIAAAVARKLPLSVALGDQRNAAETRGMLGHLGAGRAEPRYIKLGFAGVESPAVVLELLSAAVSAAADLSWQPDVVAVAYADHGPAECLPPAAVAALAAESGAAGVLLDTCTKDGRDLFAWLSPDALRRWTDQLRGAGLLSAVAGGLHLPVMQAVVDAAPDLVGVRTAACEGGRGGRVCEARVRALRAALSAGKLVA